MKKTLALVLAALMTAGMTTVAFADATNDNSLEVTLVDVTDGNYLYVDANDDGRFGSADDKFTTNNGTEHLSGAIAIAKPTADKVPTSVDLSVVKGGKKVAIPLLDEHGNKITEKDDVRRTKVKAEWKVGDLEEKPEIEFVKIGDEYVYAVTFTLPEAAETKTTDLAGSISVYESSSQLKDDYNDKELVTLNFGSEYGYKVEEFDKVTDWNKVEVVDFDGIEDVETMSFGDDFEFEVDLAGQGKLNLKWNSDFNKEFAAMYDYANIDFINFVKEPSFNKNGVAYIYADEDAYIYEVTADGAKEISGLKWDEDYEAWTFKTRTLKSYAISDVELTEKTVTEDDSSSTTEDGGKKNPDTGR
ncbi:hypothetical protein H9X81_03280 [Hydrogenoanaerobacterium saccharovorans]|uniref:Uncharacterized protein n=1 Tax=Hydrogenoanaerobacterium saccharovorans TaxID=474960 RepID=A0ABS2GMM2_9FIRM|nr:hypothetical protein [Hydrogenoanaerobacterium saccharovorans]MBM6922715.1 hypothetical protein [Hydrogenoanaerobacterium saccharovorans]